MQVSEFLQEEIKQSEDTIILKDDESSEQSLK